MSSAGAGKFTPRQAQALVVEDDPVAREGVSGLIRGLGFDVDDTDSVETAEGWVRTAAGAYALAVIDWDMSRSPDGDGLPTHAEARALTAAPVLEALEQTSRWTRAVVWAGQLGRVATQAAISRAHPVALLQDKSLGEGALRDRVRALLGCRVGDLELDCGMVRHAPSGLELPNRLATMMLVAHPSWVRVPWEDRGLQSLLFRFRRWLREVGSNVEVVLTYGANRYHLRVREDGDGGA
jgi:CheY-like chemotaxis protein